MATREDLVMELKELSRIQASEGFSEETLGKFIDKAMNQHDSSLTLESLPVAEEEPVLILAQIKVCLARAAAFAQEASLSGTQGYGTDRNTPYYKTMDFIKTLTARYSEVCESLDLSDGRVVVGRIFKRDQIADALVPLMQTDSDVNIVLSKVSSGNSEAIIQWSAGTIMDFRAFLVYHIEGTDPIYQAWNFRSSHGTPYINNSASKILESYEEPVTCIKVQDLNLAVVNRFLVVLSSRSGRYSYSNEISIPATP